MIVPNSGYRPNPDRSIIIDGKFDEGLISRVTPTLLKLQKTRDPLTVYILNSPGGPVHLMESVIRLLKAPNQESKRCKIITVVIRKAASAAAELLCSGDYTIAYPGSIIHYHGGRIFEDSPLTKERTNLLAQFLRWTTDIDAWDLATKIERRFLLRFLTSKDKFAEIRARNTSAQMTDFECFLDLLNGQLSKNGKTICQAARDRYKRYETLLTKLPRKKRGRQRRAVSEYEQIKVILDFDLEENRKNKDWTFRYGGLGGVTEDFYLLTEYIEGKENDRLNKWCLDWWVFAVTTEEKGKIEAITDEKVRSARIIQVVRPRLAEAWSFFVALCHALHEGENELTAKDAYWLGLIDEVLGDPDMAALRLITEYKEDPPPSPEPTPQPSGNQDAEKKETADQ